MRRFLLTSRWYRSGPMSLHRLLPLLAFGLNLVLLGTALAPERRSARNRVFACFVGALAVWNAGVLALRGSTSADAALVWERLLHLGVIAVPPLFYHYVIVFLDAPRRDRILAAGYTACAVLWLTSPTPLFLRGVTPTVWGFMPVAGPLYPLFFVYFNLYMALGLHRLVRARRSMASSFMRNRASLVVAGVSVSLLGGVVDLTRFIVGWDGLYPPGIPANAALALALGLAILRYRLMDVGLLAKRLIGYVLTAIVLAPALFIALLVVHRWVLGTEGRELTELLAREGPILFLAFVLALPVLHRVGAMLDGLMLRRQRGVRNALVALGGDLPHVLDRQQLADRLTTALATQIPASRVSLHVIDEAGDDLKLLSYADNDAADRARAPRIGADLAAWLALSARPLLVQELMFHGHAVASLRAGLIDLERDGIELLLPLILDGRLAAVLCVGEKISGQIYERDDIELLETLLQGAAVALKNAQLYTDLRTQMDELRRTQDQLMQSAKLAAIGELAAGVAHEVNNPLMVILGHAGLLRRRGDLASIHDSLDVIEVQATRAGNMTRSLLDFARRRPRNPQRVQMRDVIERALTLVGDKRQREAIETVLLFDETDPSTWGDRDELTQVFINLIGNALDAMPDGGRLTVSTEVRRHDDVTYLSARVSDTGIGIPAEHRARIFESFFTTKPEGKGTGLGLAVTLEIVKNHEGTIEVDSAPGKGTTMIVNLPPASEDLSSSGRRDGVRCR